MSNKLVQALIKESGLTIDDVAAVVGISSATLRRWLLRWDAVPKFKRDAVITKLRRIRSRQDKRRAECDCCLGGVHTTTEHDGGS